MSKETKSNIIQVLILILGISVTFLLTNRDNQSKQVTQNKEDIAINKGNIIELKESEKEHVTKDYFDRAIQSLKDYIDK